MKLSKISFLGALVLAFTSLVAPAQAAVTYPAERAYFPQCSAQVITNCYSNAQIKRPDETTWSAPPSDVYFGINAFDIANSPSLVIDMRLNNNQGDQDLTVSLPYGTEIKVDVNTGSWQPNPQARGVSVVRSFSQSRDANQNWITSVHFSTINWSAASNCNVEEPFSNSCLNPGTASESQDPGFWNDYNSFAQVVFWGVPLSANAQTLTQLRLWDGMIISSNASGGYDPYFDPTSSSWVITNVGPGRYKDGLTTNWLYFQAFIPDRSIEAILGTPAGESLSSISFTRQDANAGTATTPPGARIERVTGGILITMPRYTFDPNPGTPPSFYSVRNLVAAPGATTRNLVATTNATTLKITMKKKAVVVAPSKASIKSASARSKTITLVARTAARATTYQASCIKGRTSKSVVSRTTTLKLTSMAKGTWTCKIRAKNSKYGAWSPTKSVRVQ
jgi:hypothetical protein